jgi:hypothetical protein
MSLLLSATLAVVPLLWVVQHARRRRREREGAADGILLLASLLCALAALATTGVAVARESRARRESIASRPIAVVIDACGVTEQRTGGRGGTRSHEIWCDVSYPADAPARRTTVRAGYPTSRAGFDAWIASHPPGSTIRLRQPDRAYARLEGLAELVPATTTARHATRMASTIALLGCALLALSRWVVFRRVRATAA